MKIFHTHLIDLILSLQKNVVEFLQDKFGIEDSEALIHRVSGALDINCHEIGGVVPPGRWVGPTAL